MYNSSHTQMCSDYPHHILIYALMQLHTAVLSVSLGGPVVQHIVQLRQLILNLT